VTVHSETTLAIDTDHKRSLASGDFPATINIVEPLRGYLKLIETMVEQPHPEVRQGVVDDYLPPVGQMHRQIDIDHTVGLDVAPDDGHVQHVRVVKHLVKFVLGKRMAVEKHALAL